MVDRTGNPVRNLARRLHGRGKWDAGRHRLRAALRTAVAPRGILAAVLVISLLHCGTRVHFLLLHEVFRRLYYMPIVMAAVTYGPRGGLASMLVSLRFGCDTSAPNATSAVREINQWAVRVVERLQGCEHMTAHARHEYLDADCSAGLPTHSPGECCATLQPSVHLQVTREARAA